MLFSSEKRYQMDPSIIGTKYDRIAHWWHDQHVNSSYGVVQIDRAMRFAAKAGKALDVGCGAGGRFVRLLQSRGFAVTGIDVSNEMIKLARANHPDHIFLHQDICTWQSDEEFDFIVAWDSIFHVPFELQRQVVTKLCNLVAHGGVLIYTCGDAYGEHTDRWHDDTFYYSSIGITENVQSLIDSGMKILHLELDQFPQNHVCIIASKA